MTTDEIRARIERLERLLDELEDNAADFERIIHEVQETSTEPKETRH